MDFYRDVYVPFLNIVARKSSSDKHFILKVKRLKPEYFLNFPPNLNQYFSECLVVSLYDKNGFEVDIKCVLTMTRYIEEGKIVYLLKSNFVDESANYPEMPLEIYMHTFKINNFLYSVWFNKEISSSENAKLENTLLIVP